MNEQRIEQLLRKTPAPKAPADLKEDLIAGIRLHPTPARQLRQEFQQGWFRRWLPALSFAALAVACLGVLGAQSYQLAELRRANEDLSAGTADLAVLREANQDAQRLRHETAELETLRKNDAALRRLRDEVNRLSSEVEALPQLREENKQLAAAVTAAAAGRPDFFAKMKTRSERDACVNNLKQIGLATRVYANDNNGREPANYLEMTNELGQSWKILQCPGDHSRKLTSWADVAAGNFSYPLFTAGLTEQDNPRIVVAECPVHHNILMLDGSVQQLSEENMTKRIGTDAQGRRVFAPDGQ